MGFGGGIATTPGRPHSGGLRSREGDNRAAPCTAPGIPRVLASLARVPFRRGRKGTVGCPALSRSPWGSVIEGITGQPPAPPRACPCVHRCARTRPLSSGTKGDGGLPCPVTLALGLCHRGGNQAAPCTAPGIPRVLASLARAPFVGDERGRGAPCSVVLALGFCGRGGNRAAPCTVPGMPLRACCARTRPLSLGRKGTVGCPALSRSPWASPARFARAPLR